MYVSWVLGDKLRIVMSSIMRWRRGEIGLVIGGLLSVGLHERAILADRTPPTDDPTPIGTANGPKGIYGRRSLSKPPKPTILDLSHRPHHKRLPRQRFSATGHYGISTADRPHSALMPANLITLAHFSVSSTMNIPSSAGEPRNIVQPRLASRACILASVRTASASLLRRPMISEGVVLRKPMANHWLAT